MPAFLMFLIVIGILGLIIFMPWIFIWSINVLFGLSIAYTFTTWLAAFVLLAILSNSHIKKS